MLGLYSGFFAMRSENKYIFKAEWRGLKRRIFATCGIMTENGYFTDLNKYSKEKNTPRFLPYHRLTMDEI